MNGLEIDTKQRVCLPISIFDNKLDRESINPLVVPLFFQIKKLESITLITFTSCRRKQAFEKLVSGMCKRMFRVERPFF